MKIENKKGKIEFHREGSEMIIDSVYVNPSFRRQGIAKKLVKKSIQSTKYLYRNGSVDTISLCAEPQSEGLNKDQLINFYSNLGFKSHSDCDELMELSIN